MCTSKNLSIPSLKRVTSFPYISTPLGQRCLMVGTSRLHFRCTTPLGQRCIMVATVAVAFPSHDSVGPTMLRSRLHFRHITPSGHRCIMVATVAVAFPSHHSVGPTLYNGSYGCGCISVATLRWANVVLWLLRSRLHFRHITPLGQRCIMVATVAVAFPSQHSVGPTLYNGCNGRGCISVTSLRWANVV